MNNKKFREEQLKGYAEAPTMDKTSMYDITTGETIPRPRFKTTRNGAYDFIVDNKTGRSIWRMRYADGNSYQESIRVCGIYNMAEEARIQILATAAALPISASGALKELEIRELYT